MSSSPRFLKKETMQVRGVHGDNDGDWAGQSIGIMAQALTPLSRGGGGGLISGLGLHETILKKCRRWTIFIVILLAMKKLSSHVFFLSFFFLFLYTEADKAVGETCTAIKSFTD